MRIRVQFSIFACCLGLAAAPAVGQRQARQTPVDLAARRRR